MSHQSSQSGHIQSSGALYTLPGGGTERMIPDERAAAADKDFGYGIGANLTGRIGVAYALYTTAVQVRDVITKRGTPWTVHKIKDVELGDEVICRALLISTPEESPFNDLCRIHTYTTTTGTGGFGAAQTLTAGTESPCNVLPDGRPTDAMVAGGIEQQAAVVIELPYDAVIGASDLIEVTRAAGEVVSGVYYRVIGTDRPHNVGWKQVVRTTRVSAP